MPVWPKLIEPIECLMACHAETVDGKPPNAKWPNSSIQRGLPIDAKATIKAQLSSPSRALAAIFRTLPAVVSTSMKASRMEASLVGGRVRIFLNVSQFASRETLYQEPNPLPPSMYRWRRDDLFFRDYGLLQRGNESPALKPGSW